MADETVVDATPAPETQPAQTGASAGTFTQADVDRIIGERLTRAQEAWSKKLLGDLGVDNLDNAKTALKAHSEAEAARKSELEKQADKFSKLEKQFNELTASYTALVQARRTDKRNGAIRSAFAEAKAVDLDDLMTIVEATYADAVGKIMGEDDAIDAKALKGLVETVRKEKARFFTPATPGSLSNNNGRSPDTMQDRIKQALGDKRIINF